MKNRHFKMITKVILGIGCAFTLMGAIYFALLKYDFILAVCLIGIAVLLLMLITSPEKKKKVMCLLIPLCTIVILWFVSIDKVEVPDEIEKVTISFNSGPLSTFSYTDEAKIACLHEYFSSLNPRIALINPDNAGFAGGSWTVQIKTATEEVEIILFGDFIKMPDGTWRTISIKKSNKFSDILREHLPDVKPQSEQFYEDMWITVWE